MIAIVAGTRSEIIKIAPVMAQLKANHTPFEFWWTGQHWEPMMSDIFFRDFNITPTEAQEGRYPDMLACLPWLTTLIQLREPSVVVVQGGTRSALAGALAANELSCPVAHVEAGLRSYEAGMHEENARRQIDAIAVQLFAPTPMAMDNLRSEKLLGGPTPGLHRLAYLTGNTVVDAMRWADGVGELKYITRDPRRVLVTIHRPGPVERFDEILAALDEVRAMADALIWPLHPRFADSHWPSVNRFEPIEPLPYAAFLLELAKASLVITDSGGVQEEAAILGTPTLTVRPATERPETIAWGINRLVEPADIPDAVRGILDHAGEWEWPKAGAAYGTNPSREIAEHLEMWR